MFNIRVWGQQLVVRGQLHLPTVKLVMRVARVAPKRARCFNSKGTSFHVVLELEHVKPVDQRSAIRKADAVLPAFTRAGQHHDTLKRVAQRGRCRLRFVLLFLVGLGVNTSLTRYATLRAHASETWKERRVCNPMHLIHCYVGRHRRANSSVITSQPYDAAAPFARRPATCTRSCANHMIEPG